MGRPPGFATKTKPTRFRSLNCCPFPPNNVDIRIQALWYKAPYSYGARDAASIVGSVDALIYKSLTIEDTTFTISNDNQQAGDEYVFNHNARNMLDRATMQQPIPTLFEGTALLAPAVSLTLGSVSTMPLLSQVPDVKQLQALQPGLAGAGLCRRASNKCAPVHLPSSPPTGRSVSPRGVGIKHPKDPVSTPAETGSFAPSRSLCPIRARSLSREGTRVLVVC